MTNNEPILNLEELTNKFNYNFDRRLYLSILLCLKSNEKNLILKIGNEFEFLNLEERKEFISRVKEEINWVITKIYTKKNNNEIYLLISIFYIIIRFAVQYSN